jgi:hypothetical protein
VRILSLAVALTTVLFFSTSSGFAASGHKAKASYRATNESASVSEAGGTPPNCIRESCGRLWCWHMRGETSSK